MKNKHTLNCHDCGKSVTLLIDDEDDLEIKEIQCCPICGSDNIEIEEK